MIRSGIGCQYVVLLNYINKPRELDLMLDPAKVFDKTLAASLFNPNEKINMFKA